MEKPPAATEKKVQTSTEKKKPQQAGASLEVERKKKNGKTSRKGDTVLVCNGK